MELIVGIDSTWSLRAWLCCQIAQIDMQVKVIDLSASQYKTHIEQYNRAGLVPVLVIDNYTVHDSLAIAEFINEKSAGLLYPESISDRAIARSLTAELHSGFMNLRSQCPFTLDPVEPLNNISPELQREINRVADIFSKAQGDFMFQQPGIVDAFYAILAVRLATYDIKLTPKAERYKQRLLAWPLLVQAIELAKHWRELS